MPIETGVARIAERAGVAGMAASLYASTLIITLAIALTAICAIALRKRGPEARALVWRASVGGILLVLAGRQLPLHWIAWVVPSALAVPLIALGRAQMIGSVGQSAVASWSLTRGADSAELVGVSLILVVYAAGAVVVLLPTIIGGLRARRRISRATRISGDQWLAIVRDVCSALSLHRDVRIFIDENASVPMTWGFVRPVVVLPPIARTWSRAQCRIVLLHELAHVRASDWAFNVGARLVSSLYWFHPGAWWIANNLRNDCELACDDTVLSAGVRRSDYAELLVSAANALLRDRPAGAALALSQKSGLRARLTSVLDATHDIRPLQRGWTVVATLIMLAVVCPLSAVQLAPTRAVLTTLMQDTRWESRAYAVLGLAQRPDSIAVARSAAERDPNPRVRAWARYALGEQAERPDLRAVIQTDVPQ